MSFYQSIFRSSSAAKSFVSGLALAIAVASVAPVGAHAGQSKNPAADQQRVMILERMMRNAQAGNHDVHCSFAKYGKLCGDKFAAICKKYGGTYESHSNGDADCKGPFSGPSS